MFNNDRVYETAWVKGAINACEEALAQPAQKNEASSLQEPVSLGDFDRMTKAECVEYIDYLRKEIDLLRFKEWQGLSDDEISKVISDEQIPVRTGKTANRFARAIEQALKERNT